MSSLDLQYFSCLSKDPTKVFHVFFVLHENFCTFIRYRAGNFFGIFSHIFIFAPIIMSLWWINMVILRCYGNKNKKTLFFSWFNLFSPLSIHSLSFPFSLLFLPFFFLHFLISFPTAILSYFPHPRSGIFGKIYKKFWGLDPLNCNMPPMEPKSLTPENQFCPS